MKHETKHLLLSAALLGLLPSTAAAVDATLGVNLADSIRPVTHVATGSLYGLTESLPADIDKDVAPLKPNVFLNPARSGRGYQQGIAGAFKMNQRLKNTTGKVQIRLADILPGWPYQFKNMNVWKDSVRAVVADKKKSPVQNWDGYEIWNEPDGTWKSENGDFNSGLWKQTYDLLRQLDPGCKIIGPSYSYYNSSRMDAFLKYCKENNCLPDVISWHQWGSEGFVAAYESVRNIEKKYGISPRKISINEYSSGEHTLEGCPGVSVPFISKFERYGVESAMISWWFTNLPGRLGSLLTANNERGGGWYLYKWYGDMAGYMAKVTPPNDKSDGVDGFANVDLRKKTASIILGGNTVGTTTVKISGIPASFGPKVKATVEQVTWADKDKAVAGTTIESAKDYALSGGAIDVPVKIANAYYAYRISLKPVVEQAPWGGLAQSIPGTIEMENYDLGGEGTAYHDEDDVNSGDVYRTDEGVDLDGNDKDGYVLGWTKKDEWLAYTIDVKEEDNYVFSARAASGLDGSGFHLSIDGTDVTGTITVPNTGSWTDYTTVTGTTKPISAGKHTLRLTIDGAYVNLDKISFRPKNARIDYAFTSPAQEMEVLAGEDFTVSWSASEGADGTYNLKWVNDKGETMTLKKGLDANDSHTSGIPDYFAGQTGHYQLAKVEGGLIPSDFDGQQHTVSNPLIWADVPDVSICRAGDTYYMASTTMHMNPGVPIMASKDLARWRTINYAHQALDNGDNLNMNAGKNAYGKGSWASSIKYKDGTWYVLTPSYTTGKTHIFKTDDIEGGKWQTATLPFYHDPSLLLDDDGRVYVIYGGGNISIVELSADAMSVKPGSNPRTLLTKPASIAGSNFYVECEGSQAMKKGDYYYVFLISWPAGSCRSVLCYRSKSLTGTWEGKVLLQDNGVAQGGVFQKEDGSWFGMFFRDNGSVGRIPYYVPAKWENDWPVLGNSGKVPATLQMPAAQEDGYGLVTSDEFEENALPLEWQWNHNPDSKYWSLANGALRLQNGRTDASLVDTRNTLTQRTFGPNCSGWTKLSTKGLKDGDFAGLCALQEKYGFAGVKVTGNTKTIVMVDATSGTAKEAATVNLAQDDVYLRIDMNYQNQADKASFFYSLDGKTWTKFGNEIKMEYTLSHFMGYRYGLFCFNTKATGGYADFDFFRIGKDANSPIYLSKEGKETVVAESATISIVKELAVVREVENATVAIGPNPASDVITASGMAGLKKMELYNTTGQKVLTSQSNQMSVSALPSGTYVLLITGESATTSYKVIVK